MAPSTSSTFLPVCQTLDWHWEYTPHARFLERLAVAAIRRPGRSDSAPNAAWVARAWGRQVEGDFHFERRRVGGAEGSDADRGACPVDILGEASAALDQVLGLLRYRDSDVGAEPH